MLYEELLDLAYALLYTLSNGNISRLEVWNSPDLADLYKWTLFVETMYSSLSTDRVKEMWLVINHLCTINNVGLLTVLQESVHEHTCV